MIEVFFTVLFLIVFLGFSIYFYYFNKKAFPLLILILLLSLILVNVLPWQLSSIAFLFIAIPLIRKKLSYSNTITLSMFGTVLAAYFLLMLYLNKTIALLTLLGTLSVGLICLFGIWGIFEEDIKKYLILSNLIQLTFIFLDISVAKLGGEISTLGTIHILNYAIAGSLLFITIGVFSNNGVLKKLKDLQGSYYKNRGVALPLIITCLSLAGIPGLNIFISELLLFKKAFPIEPIITLLGIFAALVLFIMYFKVVYIILVGKVLKPKKVPLLLNLYNAILAGLCVIFGLLPFIQFYILEKLG